MIIPRKSKMILAYKITEQSYQEANIEFKKEMISYFKRYDQIRKSFYKSLLNVGY